MNEPHVTIALLEAQLGDAKRDLKSATEETQQWRMLYFTELFWRIRLEEAFVAANETLTRNNLPPEVRDLPSVHDIDSMLASLRVSR